MRRVDEILYTDWLGPMVYHILVHLDVPSRDRGSLRIVCAALNTATIYSV